MESWEWRVEIHTERTQSCSEIYFNHILIFNSISNSIHSHSHWFHSIIQFQFNIDWYFIIQVNCCSISHDESMILSGSNDRTLKLWNVNTGNEIFTLNGHSDTVNWNIFHFISFISICYFNSQFISKGDMLFILKWWKKSHSLCFMG